MKIGVVWYTFTNILPFFYSYFFRNIIFKTVTVVAKKKKQKTKMLV